MRSLLAVLTAAFPLVQAAEFTALELLANPFLRQHQEAPGVEAAGPYPDNYLCVPIDHFHNDTRYAPHTNDSFLLQYWFDARYYQPGGPVFLLAAGETAGNDRWPLLSHGMVTQLAQKYHGLGVILEHRYYGRSYPFDNLTTDNIRFLTTEQAIADYAYFANHVVFPGLEGHDLRPAKTPWIAYGGSYAGAFVAFLRKLYPQVYWGAIGSSAVTAAIEDYWQYYEPIRTFGPRDCISQHQTFIQMVDRVLIDHGDNSTLKSELLHSMGIPCNLKSDEFAGLLSTGLDAWQSRNWDKTVGSPVFRDFCNNITSPEILYPATRAKQPFFQSLLADIGHNTSHAELTGVLNEVGWLNATTFTRNMDTICPRKPPPPSPKKILKKTATTSWMWQVCTEWGYFQNGASVPKYIKPLISRTLSLASMSSYCPRVYGLTTRPDTDRINRYGGFTFAYPRVAFIDGLADPWRLATPHADGLPHRQSTDEQPFLLMEIPADQVWDNATGAVHHWEENGLSAIDIARGRTPPPAVADTQNEVLRFVGVWLEQWGQTPKEL